MGEPQGADLVRHLPRPCGGGCRGGRQAHRLRYGPVETRTGSAATNYAQFFNTQLGLPVDNYLVIPREGLAKLIDAVAA